MIMSRAPARISELREKLHEKGVDLSQDRLRAQLWYLKTDSKLVESPSEGVFRLSELGERYIKERGLDLV